MLAWARLLTILSLLTYPATLVFLLVLARFGREGPLVRGLRRVFIVLGIGYPIALLASALSLRFIGEGWWATTIVMYLPRIGFAIPLPILVMGLVILGPRRYLWSQLLALVILLFPLMGFSVALPSFYRGSKPAVRIFSQNVDSGDSGYDAIARAVLDANPDIVLFQEVYGNTDSLTEPLRKAYPFTNRSHQFLAMSRYPIVAAQDPDRIPFYGKMRSPRFYRYVFESPIGRLAVYNVHPISPRDSLASVRGEGLRREIASGRLFTGANTGELKQNNGLRTLQTEALAKLAVAETLPVVIAGDTNLPGLSRTFGRNLSAFQDAHEELSFGFGYTYPVPYEWMRIDRILASDTLRFVWFETGCRGVSDHACVVAEVQARE